MKLLYTTMYSALLMGAIGFNATAQQQLPNSGFEEAWVDCTPWTSSKTTQIGQNPTDWCISHVAGMNGGAGKTSVGEKVEGYNSVSAAKLINTPNSILKTQIVPSYITLGKTWSTAQGFAAKNKDGGSFGGHAFTERPAGLQFMYKRTRGTAKPNEQSTVVAYLWKGHVTQNAVPGDIASGNTTSVDMIDRDRCVLEMDMNGCQGGDVTKDANFELIASINTPITENAEEWTKFSAKFDYKSEANPEMINVILAAGDYFGGASVVGKDNSLIVDDVRVFYEHEGDLSITIADNNPIKSEAAIQIIPNGDGTCTFTLPNFKLQLTPEDDPLEIGDIVVDNVTITQKDGADYYEGTVNKLVLLGGITAHVYLHGTLENMKIDVVWFMSDEYNPEDESNTPIFVEFNKKPDSTTGITDITVDVDNSNAPVEFYNLQGVRVSGDNLTPGIYVRRQGSAVSKVLVK